MLKKLKSEHKEKVTLISKDYYNCVNEQTNQDIIRSWFCASFIVLMVMLTVTSNKMLSKTGIRDRMIPERQFQDT